MNWLTFKTRKAIGILHTCICICYDVTAKADVVSNTFEKQIAIHISVISACFISYFILAVQEYNS